MIQRSSYGPIVVMFTRNLYLPSWKQNSKEQSLGKRRQRKKNQNQRTQRQSLKYPLPLEHSMASSVLLSLLPSTFVFFGFNPLRSVRKISPVKQSKGKGGVLTLATYRR
mmetsp:Transcript_40191/g.45946  ORF Transcript_40191/g.45946 Transcript_40191/m.45946 type:complete len:109 (-) Transcript_40191:1171-1497(-)